MGECLLSHMAMDLEYLEPLRKFSKRVLYANTMNNNRVSFSSGMIWPSFGNPKEAALVKTLFTKDSGKVFEVKGIKELESNTEYEMQNSYQSLNELDWMRYAVTIDSRSAHARLANPAGFADILTTEQEVLNHLATQILL